MLPVDAAGGDGRVHRAKVDALLRSPLAARLTVTDPISALAALGVPRELAALPLPAPSG